MRAYFIGLFQGEKKEKQRELKVLFFCSLIFIKFQIDVLRGDVLVYNKLVVII